MPRNQSKTITISKPNPKLPPPPFVAAPESLNPFLNTLSKSSVYLTHIDPAPRGLKRSIFTVPVLLNFSFIALLAWRFSTTLPWYYSLLHTLWTNKGIMEAYAKLGAWAFIKAELRHFLTFCIDYGLLSIVAPWPYTFFFEKGGNPTSWRLRAGFHERELIVRISRGWNVKDLFGGDKFGAESPFWKTRILPYTALDKMSKTGYLMMDSNWDLAFGPMTKGQALLAKEIQEDEVNGKVFAWWSPKADDEQGQWIMWDFRKEMYMKDGPPLDRAAASKIEGDAEEGRKMMMRFRDKLTELGKEDLFFRWVELIQYESSRPGGFTKERQEDAGKQVKQLFVDAGIDFEEFEKSVGIEGGRLVN